MLSARHAIGLLTILLSALTVQADDTRSTALSIQPNSSANDSLSPGGDVDYWRFELPARGELEVWTTGNLDTVGVIEDRQGNELALEDGGGSGYNFYISGIADTGVHYVRVYSYNAEETGPYILYVRFVPEAGSTSPSGGTHRDCADCPEMVSIPGGTFRMGELNGVGEDYGLPVHSVTVPAFRLGKYEVTVGQFRRFVEASGYRTDAERNAGSAAGCYTYTDYNLEWTPGHSWRSPGYAIDDNQPVVCVSWNDAQAYVEWLSAETGGHYRLPTEAEWEYAARAGSTTEYSWGNDIASNWENCVYYVCGDSYEYTAPVGSFPANAWGLHDMHGNVWEWVQDCWNDSYQGAPTDGSAWESGDCGRRVLRGGSWYNTARHLRSANRSGIDRADRDFNLGFRLAQDK